MIKHHVVTTITKSQHQVDDSLPHTHLLLTSENPLHLETLLCNATSWSLI